MPIILLEATPRNLTTDSLVTVRMSSSGSADGVYLDGYEWLPAITSSPRRSMALSAGGLLQASVTVWGDVGFDINADLGNLAWANYGWAGAQATMWVGEEGQPFSSYTKTFTGTLGALKNASGKATVELQGTDDLADRDLLSARYAGTGGSEGDAALKGTLKPLAIGPCENLEPVLVNVASLIYQVSDGAVNAISKVYEMGLDLGAPTSTHTTYSALAAVSLQPGQWANAPAIGMFKLGGLPVGKITADVQGMKDGSTYVSTIGPLVIMLLKRAGLLTSQIDSASINAFTQTWPKHIKEQVKIGALCRSMIAEAGGYLLTDEEGKFFAGDWYSNSATPTLLNDDASTAPAVNTITMIGGAIPYWKIELGCDPCQSPHTRAETSPVLTNVQIDLSSLDARVDEAEADLITAQADATNALNQINDITADGVLDRSEKAIVIRDYNEITSEKPGYEALADYHGITTEKTGYTNAYSSLLSYLNSQTTPTLWNNTAGNTNITRSTFNSNWTSFYNARTTLLQKIQERAGNEAITGYLSNEAHVVYANAAGVPNSLASATGQFSVYKGITNVTASATFSVFGTPSGMTPSINSAGVYSVSALSADTATCVFRAVYGGVTIDKTFVVAKSQTGATGSTGSTGSAGLNNATVALYIRSATAPTPPSTTATWTFATSLLSGHNNGWAQLVPAANGSPLWIIMATASSNTATDTIASGEWSTPVVQNFSLDTSNMIDDGYYQADAYWTLTNSAFSTDSIAAAALATTRMITNTGTTGMIVTHTKVRVTPGVSYVMGAKLLLKAGYAGNARLQFMFYNTAGTLVGSSPIFSSYATGDGTLAADRIYDMAGDMVAPAGSATAAISATFTAAAANQVFFSRPFIRPKVLGGSVDLGDTSNIITDPDFLDTTSWQYSNALILPNGTVGDGGGRFKLRLDGAMNQVVVSKRMSVEQGRSYLSSSYQKTVSGSTGGLLQQVLWYKADGTAASSSSVIANNNSVGATGRFGGIVKPPSDAIYANFRWFKNATGDRVWDVSEPVFRAASTLGSTIVREDGTTLVTDNTAITSQGISQGIVGQAGAATDNSIQTGATKNTTTTSSTAPAGASNGDIWHDTSVNPIAVKIRFVGNWITVANLTTNTNQLTDGASLGQTSTWTGTSGRPSELTDGRISAGLDASGDLVRNITTARANASNILRYGSGGLYTGSLTATNNIVTRASSAPGSPSDGDIWVDTSVTPNLAKVRVSGAWQIASTYNTGVLADRDNVNLDLHVIQGTTNRFYTATEQGKLGGVEASADVTSVVTGTTAITVEADHTGAVASGQLPRNLAYTRTHGSTNVTTSSSWSRTVLSGTVTSTIGAASGVLNISALGSAQAVIQIISSYNSVVRTINLTINRNDALPPPPPSGGGTVSDSSIAYTSSSSYGSANGGPMTLSCGPSGTVTLSAPLDYSRMATTSGYSTAYGKWQWKATSGGSWADVASEITASTAAQTSGSGGGYGDYQPDVLDGDVYDYPGSISVNQSKTGLTNGVSYDFQLLLRVSGGEYVTFYGTATATSE